MQIYKTPRMPGLDNNWMQISMLLSIRVYWRSASSCLPKSFAQENANARISQSPLPSIPISRQKYLSPHLHLRTPYQLQKLFTKVRLLTKMTPPINSTAAQTIATIAFGIIATLIGAIAIWQGRRAWSSLHSHRRGRYAESEVESRD